MNIPSSLVLLRATFACYDPICCLKGKFLLGAGEKSKQGYAKMGKYLDGQHDVGVALQDLHCVAVGDVIEADPIGCQDLIAHFYAVLLCKTTGVQPRRAEEKRERKNTDSS